MVEGAEGVVVVGQGHSDDSGRDDVGVSGKTSRNTSDHSVRGRVGSASGGQTGF